MPKITLARFLIFTALTAPFGARAMTYEGVTMSDEDSASKLKLNGMALRKGWPPGTPKMVKKVTPPLFNGYVVGMYLPETLDTSLSLNERTLAVLNSKDPKRFDLVLMRDLNSNLMLDGMKDGFDENCKDKFFSHGKVDFCTILEPSKIAFENFIKSLGELKKGSRFSVQTSAEGIELSVFAPGSKTPLKDLVIKSPNLAKFIPSLWVLHPPDDLKEIRTQILGGKQVKDQTQSQQRQH